MSRHLSMRTANPALQSETFKKSMADSISNEKAMTINGVVNKTGFSLLLLIFGASFTWSNPELSGLAITGSIVGLILAFVTIFNTFLNVYIIFYLYNT